MLFKLSPKQVKYAKIFDWTVLVCCNCYAFYAIFDWAFYDGPFYMILIMFFVSIYLIFDLKMLNKEY